MLFGSPRFIRQLCPSLRKPRIRLREKSISVPLGGFIASACSGRRLYFAGCLRMPKICAWLSQEALAAARTSSPSESGAVEVEAEALAVAAAAAAAFCSAAAPSVGSCRKPSLAAAFSKSSSKKGLSTRRATSSSWRRTSSSTLSIARVLLDERGCRALVRRDGPWSVRRPYGQGVGGPLSPLSLRSASATSGRPTNPKRALPTYSRCQRRAARPPAARAWFIPRS